MKEIAKAFAETKRRTLLSGASFNIISSSARTRTWNLAVNSRPLCRIELPRNAATWIISRNVKQCQGWVKGNSVDFHMS
jgi:hypothetical protein